MTDPAAISDRDVSTEGAWDDFLGRVPQGQFQQTSSWARLKQAEGWQLVRRVFPGPQGVEGGYQLLWKRSKFLRMGYVSKGPVTQAASLETLRAALLCLKEDAQRLRLAAVILQLPDEATPEARGLAADLGFVTCNPAKVIETTLRVDVREGPEAIRGRMGKSTLRHLRQGQQRGVSLREGTEADLPVFYELMQSSCRRQRARPNPASPELLRLVWTAFASRNAVRMTLALKDGHVIAGQMSIGHGKCLFLWKKGWNGREGSLYPNLLLEDDCLRWAHAAGYEYCDFGSLDPRVAEALRDGIQPGPRTLRKRDIFNLQFGGHPVFLPPAMAYSPSWFIRLLLRTRGLCERLVR